MAVCAHSQRDYKSKKQLILYIGAPLIGVFLSFMTNANGGAETLNIGILDQDGGEVAQDTAAFLKGLDHVKISEETVRPPHQRSLQEKWRRSLRLKKASPKA